MAKVDIVDLVQQSLVRAARDVDAHRFAQLVGARLVRALDHLQPFSPARAHAVAQAVADGLHLFEAPARPSLLHGIAHQHHTIHVFLSHRTLTFWFSQNMHGTVFTPCGHTATNLLWHSRHVEKQQWNPWPSSSTSSVATAKP